MIEARSPREFTLVKSVPGARYDAARARWTAPVTTESYDVLAAMGQLPANVTRPSRGRYHIERDRKALVLLSPPEAAAKAKAFPDRRYWKPGYGERGAWIFSATARNVQHALEQFPSATWSEDAAKVRDEVASQLTVAEDMRLQKSRAGLLDAADYKFNEVTPPFAHQRHVFALSRDRDEFALFMEMGTGKTRVMVDTGCYLRAHGKIDAVLVICPNSVKDSWAEEIIRMSPEWTENDVMVWSASAPKRVREELARFYGQPNSGSSLKWLIANVEGLSSDRLTDACLEFVTLHKVLLIVDESSRIKTPGAKRTKHITSIGRKAKYRRIMSGTPVTQGPLDLYSQFRFLDPHITGFGSYYAFRNRYAIMGGFNGKQVIGYANLEELTNLIDPYVYRVLRSECIDLPPKVFERVSVELSPQQRRAYDQMKNDMVTEHAGQTVSATIVLTQMLRLQQIVGGFLPIVSYNELTMLEETHVEKIDGPNAKIEVLLDLLQDSNEQDKVIVWARFRAEIGLIAETLRAKYGPDSTVEFHGGTSPEERTANRLAFQDPDSGVRFFVGQTETGGIGITLTAANTVVYFSNSFSLESRLQSEDRAHRIGQKRTVTYVDLVAKNTLDPKLLTALRSKKNLADMITGDDWQGWI